MFHPNQLRERSRRSSSPSLLDPAPASSPAAPARTPASCPSVALRSSPPSRAARAKPRTAISPRNPAGPSPPSKESDHHVQPPALPTPSAAGRADSPRSSRSWPGLVVLAAGTIAAPRAGLDPAFVSWLVGLRWRSGSPTSWRPTGCFDVARGAARLVSYLAAIGIGVAAYGLLLALTGLDPFGATSSLPSERAWAEGIGLLDLDDRPVARGCPVRAQGRAAAAGRPSGRPPLSRLGRRRLIRGYPRSTMTIETTRPSTTAPAGRRSSRRSSAGSTPASRRIRSCAPIYPEAGPRGGEATATPVPDPVLGRPDDLRRANAATRASGCATRRSPSGRPSGTAGWSTCGPRSPRWRRRRMSPRSSTRYFAMAAEAMRNRD